ncbi:hypothetical protein IGJ51_000378 [Enterococcus sp. DIV0802c]|uniref:hypothetical protein n=1 Tax=Enterococcus sp. DIV0802c TaxID=2774743 RepID=UPI003F22AE04
MKTINIEMIRQDQLKIELDPEFFNEEWFEKFRQYFYNFYTLRELAEHIAYNVIYNEGTIIEGIRGYPLINGQRPIYAKNDSEVNKHVNVISMSVPEFDFTCREQRK